MKTLLYVVAGAILVWPVGALAQEGRPGDQQDQQGQHQDVDQAAPGAPAPQLELLNAGAEPRRQLRYAPEVDRRERATFTNAMTATITADGQQMPAEDIPPITLVIGATTGVLVEDRFMYLFDVEDVRVGGEGQDAGSRDEQTVRQAFTPAIGATGVAEVSRRGELRVFEIAGLDEMPPTVRPRVESMSSQAAQFTHLFPAEPVGVGARWRVVTLQTNGDIQVEQTSTATLKSIKDNLITISFEVAQSATEQDLGERMGQNMRLLHQSGEGKGEVKLDLNRLVPLRSTSTITTTMRMAIGDRTLEQKLTVKMELSGELVEPDPSNPGPSNPGPDTSGNR